MPAIGTTVYPGSDEDGRGHFPTRAKSVATSKGPSPLRRKRPRVSSRSDMGWDACAGLVPLQERRFETCTDDGSVVSFEDETDRTAADYHVLPVNPPPAPRKDAVKRRSLASVATPTSSHALQPVLSPSDTTPTTAFPPQRLGPVNLPFAFDELRDRQKVASFNEAFLLRHFRKTLGPWVLYPILRSRYGWIKANRRFLVGCLRS